MAINLNKYTTKSQEAVAGAQELAQNSRHPEITPVHLLTALLMESDSIISTLLEHLNVRQLELLAADLAAGVKVTPKKKVPKALSLELKDMQERLRNAVGVQRVTIQGGDKRGKVILSYRNAEELELIYEALETLEKR